MTWKTPSVKRKCASGIFFKKPGMHQENLALSDCYIKENPHVYDKCASEYVYYHNDHLGTPQLITDQSQQIVWQASYNPFGEATITTGTVENNIRFAGQYLDSETNLHYNYFRYYDPSVGRYITSDPIGLEGDINTYNYVGANPIVFIDPFGLIAEINCFRCNGIGEMRCTIFQDGLPTHIFMSNQGTNVISKTKGDPFGTNGPLPPGTFGLPMAYSPKFKRNLPSPTNNGIPGQVVTPHGTLRKGVRVHSGSLSHGCLTCGPGASGKAKENLITNVVQEHTDSGGTTLSITDLNCECGNGITADTQL